MPPRQRRKDSVRLSVPRQAITNTCDATTRRSFASLVLLLQVFLFNGAYGSPSTISSSYSKGTATASKWDGSETDIHKSQLNAEKYSSLPHTIFAPDGRLYNIETNARSVSDADDRSSSLVVAMKFGSGNDESIIMLSSSHMSPHLPSHGDICSLKKKEDRKPSDDHNERDGETRQTDVKGDSMERLWSYPHHHTKYNNHARVKINMPISILPSKIIFGTGGTAADSMALHKKILKIGVSLYNENDNMRSTHRIQGTILSSTLAKKIASSLQLPTQSAAGDRMLASAAIVIGQDSKLVTDKRIGGKTLKPKYSIWRCDSTGQFWNCYMAAVGRGAGTAEAVIMSHIGRKIKEDSIASNDTNSMKVDDLTSNISSKDVQEYLSTLSFDEAILLAVESFAKALNLSFDDYDSSDVFHQIGMQGILVRPKENPVHEIILEEILKNALCNKRN